eukprot:COSAG01_NODE_12_length_41732_cov_160.472964_35_plen_86_part_00
MRYAEILEVTGQPTTQRAYLAVGAIFVVGCVTPGHTPTHADADELIASAPQVSFIVSTLVRQKLLGDGPRQAPAAPGKAAKQKTG